ncbi:MAG TPA: hypothetical protein VHX67_05695 [Acidimicrobiales bacterium]|jgi:hypothetical protein|nr:hypothetical protein [Acidimicrobiales bacterium]
MRGIPGRHLQLGLVATLAAVAAPVLLGACGGSGSPTPTSPRNQTSTTTTPASAATTTVPAPPSGPLTQGAPIAIPFSAARVTAAESPDGAVFAAPQDPNSPTGAVAWVIDGNGPAVIAEHVPTGIAALAADGTNFYVATYSTLFAYNRTSGNQDGQWTMPAVPTANSSNNDLVALAAANGSVFVSITRGNTVSAYTVNPSTTTAPHLLLSGLGDAVGSDGSVYYERTDHRLAARRPNGATALGPTLADKPNGLGGGVQYLDVIAGGAVWVSEPAGQGLDATYTTYDAATLHQLGSFQGSVTSNVVDSSAGALVLENAGNDPSCPEASPSTPTSCVFNIVPQGQVSNAVGVGSAVMLLGPDPAVIVSDTNTQQFDLNRLT